MASVEQGIGAVFLCEAKVKCRICGSSNVKQVFSLGKMPLANNLADTPDAPCETFPLDLVFCMECSLLALRETVAPEKMFSRYLYLSSTSRQLVEQAKALTAKVAAEQKLGKNSLVVEIGSNDGYLLENYHQRGIPVLGVDPGEQPAEQASLRGVPTLVNFFDEMMAKYIVSTHGPADIIHANNVLAHVPDPNDFAAGLKRLLKREGTAIIEVQSLRALIDKVEFDQIYHEHVSYFSLGALYRLFDRNGLFITAVERIPTHGGSIRVYVKRQDTHKAANWLKVTEDIGRWLDQIESFAFKVEERCAWLRKQMEDRFVIGFGAAAKATVLIHHANLKKDILFIADDNPLKQGKFIPGTNILINRPERIPTTHDPYMLIFSWNYADEIMARFPGFQGRFIIPMPEPRTA